MTNLKMQNLCRETMKYLAGKLTAGMSLNQIRNLCEQFMLEHGADSFWYWGVGALVFAGEETSISISGKDYKTSDRTVMNNDLITVDLSPQHNHIWGDYARTLIIENGKVVTNIADIQRQDWKQGLEMELYLHKTLMESVNADMTFEKLYFDLNAKITGSGFINFDFHGNLGHSIVEAKNERIYIEKGNHTKLSEVKMFTFEPHIGFRNSQYGYKWEDIYYFDKGKLMKL